MAKRPRPKTGERRVVRRPLKIDLLPEGVKNRILELRAGFVGWMEIERLSRLPVALGAAAQAGGFVPWAELDPRVRAAFPDSHLPHTDLHRWYDLRVDQVRRDVETQAESARQIAKAFLAPGYENLAESIKNALADAIFPLIAAAADPERLKKELFELGYVVAKLMQSQTAAAKADVDRKKLELEIQRRQKELKKSVDEAANKIRSGKSLTISDINRIRERVFGLPAETPASH